MEYLEDFDNFENLPRIKNMPDERLIKKMKPKPDRTKINQAELLASLQDQSDEAGDYSFTYDASRHERAWIMNSLGLFYEMHWFDDILRIVKGGKEASVYQCQTSAKSPIDGELLAAKVYRPRRFRNLKNDYIYREGRDELDDSGNTIINEGKLKAIRQRTNYGRQVMHTSWIEHEFKTMQILYAAGADIPKPFASSNNAILMQFIGEQEMAAPTLSMIDLDRTEANFLFERVVHNVELMLQKERVHADLSAFNILYWDGEIKLIDFPQAVSPSENQNAYLIFKRDIQRLCEYFIRQGVIVDYHDLARKLWQVHEYNKYPKIDLNVLDVENDQDRAYWEKMRDDK